MKYFYFIAFLFFLSAFAFGQEKYTSHSRTAIKYYENARSLTYLNNFSEATTLLKAAIKQDNQFIESHLLLADIYRITFEYLKAKESYQNAFKISSTYAPEMYYPYAECELKTGDYQSALIHYQNYKLYGKPNFDRINLTDKYIQDCLFAIEAVKHPVPFSPQNLGKNINTKNQEYLATLTTDESTLIFTRQINANEDFYKSEKVTNEWAEATYLSENINTPIYNEGAQSISPDGQFLFFTICNSPNGYGRCDIYVSKKEGKEWSKPINLGLPINTKGFESQPSLSSDGKTLYFVSDRSGGFGSYDIWKSKLAEDGNWGIPENLGPKINTKFDEQSPFIHPDNKTLYFSSNGWMGMGSKDLFISRLDSTNNWSLPENLGYPINTYGEESGLTINSSGTKAFFSSNNFTGFGGFDIYSFDLPKNLRPQSINYIKGIVYDQENKNKLAALIDIIDLKSNLSIYSGYADEVDGQFLVTLPKGSDYSLNVSKEGYLFYSENFSLEKYKDGVPIILEIPLQKIALGKKVILKNIFFDTNKFDLKPESLSELDKLVRFLKNYPNVKIEIDGHTDDVGNDEANMLLSINRAKSVYDFLVQHEIKIERLSYKGFGETSPISENNTLEGRANNRRTEFTITEIK